VAQDRADADEGKAGPAERWLRSQTDLVALALVALGLVARLRAAHAPFLTPDEVLHLQIANVPGFLDTYRASLTNAHPPLFLLLLHVWERLVRTDWQLRLLPVAFGTAFLWTTYRWARSSFGRAGALSTLALLAFLPSLVLVSAEIRAYALLLWLMAAALAALDRAFREKRPRRLTLFALSCALGLCTHYSAVFFVVSASIYAGIRIGVEGWPVRFVRAWAACQALFAVLCVFLYVTHISRLRGSALEREVQTTWLRTSYFRAAGESAFQFCIRQTIALFQFLLSSVSPGIIGMVLLLGAVLWLALRRQPLAILLALPFLLNLAAGLLGLYPYGGTRHSIHLILFVCAGIGIALARLSAERVWVAIGLAIALAPAGFTAAW
jgi:uncharacterized membrane protein